MVYFVGAGTGAVDLITVRGMRLLERADVIIYAGSLVNPELLAYARKDCKVHNSAELTLEEVIRIMEEAEQEGKTTVRLHTGDPSIYGAVREQMDELDRLGISYESCPGVSACFGAASSLNLEYTLPGISQSLIITRMEGRTEAPERERIESMAAHQASMAIYLSAGRIRELCRRLVLGGYTEATPAALVYKATWDEEEAYTGTIGTLYDLSVKHGITKTALVLVGDAVAHQHYHRSRLYAADFTTGFRPKLPRTEPAWSISMISFTENGRRLSERIADLLKEREAGTSLKTETRLFTKCEACRKNGADDSVLFVEKPVRDWAEEQMREKNALLFIGACGIAVRAVSSSLTDKLQDAPVLVMDEKGRYVIPLLAGHVGGANELADYLAGKTGAEQVITTATDINHKFAADLFAGRNNLFIGNKDGIVKVSSKALAGEEITISIEPGHEVYGAETGGIRLVGYPPGKPVDVVITSEEDTFGASLVLRPREYVIGLGCRKGKTAEEIRAFLAGRMEELGIAASQVYAVASISLKSGEQGIVSWCRQERIPFLTYTAEELQEVKGSFTGSSFVMEKTGVDNVCERAALKACGDKGKLVAPKYAENGMTAAVARREWKVCFDEK